jgi:hypothetical protein
MPTCPTTGVALNPMSAPKPRSATLPLSDLLLISFNSPRFWICCIHTLNPRHSHLPFHTTLVSTTSGIQHVFVFNTYGIFPQCSLSLQPPLCHSPCLPRNPLAGVPGLDDRHASAHTPRQLLRRCRRRLFRRSIGQRGRVCCALSLGPGTICIENAINFESVRDLSIFRCIYLSIIYISLPSSTRTPEQDLDSPEKKAHTGACGVSGAILADAGSSSNTNLTHDAGCSRLLGTQFTCFTGTKVQILTQQALLVSGDAGYSANMSSSPCMADLFVALQVRLSR